MQSFQRNCFQITTAREIAFERITATTKPFDVVGVDYAGPFVTRKEKTVYLLLFSCSVSRALHLELLKNQTMDGFLTAIKRLITRRGMPKIIYSDNAKTFKAAAKWLKRIIHSGELMHFCSRKNISWRFNLSRAPWWGGQFERMVGIVKQSLYKTIGRSSLSFEESEDVLLDVETILNNHPLGCIEGDIELPVLTPNMIMEHTEKKSCPKKIWKSWMKHRCKNV